MCGFNRSIFGRFMRQEYPSFPLFATFTPNRFKSPEGFKMMEKNYFLIRPTGLKKTKFD
jgi:hypothetical protein